VTVVSLSKARKARAKSQAKAQAAENRVAFGRTKAEKDAARVQSDKASRALDGARLDPED